MFGLFPTLGRPGGGLTWPGGEPVPTLQDHDFLPGDHAVIAVGGAIVADAVSHVWSLRMVTGQWDVFGSPAEELARVEATLELLEAAVNEARRTIGPVALAARQRGRDGKDDYRGCFGSWVGWL